jgi:hypothetical protein
MALEGPTAFSRYKITLKRIKIHSNQVDEDTLIVEADQDLRRATILQ